MSEPSPREPVEPVEPVVPRYGEASLAEVTPSIMAALGVDGFEDRLEVGPAESACLLLIDGLGWELLRDHPGEAPFLSKAAESGRPLTAGFPATTAASIGSIGTGVPPGLHGLVGYSFAVPGLERAVNVLRWELYGIGPHRNLEGELPPEAFQPEPTAFQRAAAQGVTITLVGPPDIANSPLQRAAMRGGRFASAHSLGDLAACCLDAMGGEGRSFTYAYHPRLDTTAHIRGCDSEAWGLELLQVDLLVRNVAERLPPEAVLAVTGDHGMVDVPEDRKVDVGDRPELAEGVRLMAGEGRARHLYCFPGAVGDVLATWREWFGPAMEVLTREEAIAKGWFGPTVLDRVRPRIGDVVTAALDRVAVFDRTVDPLQAQLVGHHGSLTRSEELVPWLVFRPSGNGGER